jgi:hypothetical protein
MEAAEEIDGVSAVGHHVDPSVGAEGRRCVHHILKGKLPAGLPLERKRHELLLVCSEDDRRACD